MAKRIPFGEPVNDSEAWAFDFLEKELPDHYVFATNIEIHNAFGRPIECDAIVIADWAVYIVDVKGYRGRLNVGKDVWSCNGKEVENPLPKVNQNSKILASRFRAIKGRFHHTPWCQGLAFVTGGTSSDIKIDLEDDYLQAFGPDAIVAALTEQSNITGSHPHQVTAEQKSAVLEVLGQTGLVESRANKIGDFVKEEELHTQGPLSVWRARFDHDGLNIPYMLKVVDGSKCSSSEQWGLLQSELDWEFKLYQELSGVGGVPYSAPPIKTGEIAALPILMPKGKPLKACFVKEISSEVGRSIIWDLVRTISRIHSRGTAHGDIKTTSIFVSELGHIEILDFAKVNGDVTKFQLADVKAIAAIVIELEIEDADIYGWAEQCQSGDIVPSEALSELLNIFRGEKRSNEVQDVEFTPISGALLNNIYKLNEMKFEDDDMSIWSAEHLLGKFDCIIRIMDAGSDDMKVVQSLFQKLSHMYHPNIERSFDMGPVTGADAFFFVSATTEGETIADELETEAEGYVIINYLRKVIQSLQYLHHQGLIHKNLTPERIIIANNNPMVTGLSIHSDAVLNTGDIEYKAPWINKDGWGPASDLYSLTKSIIHLSEVSRSFQKILPSETKEMLTKLSQSTSPFPVEGDYLKFFGLEEAEVGITSLPSKFMTEWGISTGYMTFLTLDMLNDPRPRARTQWVLNALRTRHIAGNKTNKSSMNSTISRLISANVAEKYGKKIKLTNEFQHSWASYG
tara:strand:+ start:199119 stop:201338 length:2220 start_codon:yes stop_codon:yes gene_type:complete